MIPAKKPIKAPKPAFSATLNSLLSNISPITAQTKGRTIKPQGGKMKRPSTIPIALPHTPYEPPPSFFVPQIGM